LLLTGEEFLPLQEFLQSKKNKLVDFLTKLHASDPWKKTLTERKWTDVFLTGDAFQKAITEDIKNTEGVLKELGLA